MQIVHKIRYVNLTCSSSLAAGTHGSGRESAQELNCTELCGSLHAWPG
jgi:hypothetical protein